MDIDLDVTTLKVLEEEGKKQGRSRKKHVEIVLTKHADRIKK